MLNPMTIRSFNERELALLDAVKFHRELTVAAALEFCAEEDIPPPPWAVKEAADFLIRLLKSEKTSRRGRAASCIARYRQDQWDVERWEAVEQIRMIKKKVKDELKLLKEYPKDAHEHLRRHYQKAKKWLEQGDFECAALYLTGRDAKASPQTIRKSHREVKRRAGDGFTPDRYYAFDDRFLQKIGLPGSQDKKGGTKWVSLFDLKP